VARVFASPCQLLPSEMFEPLAPKWALGVARILNRSMGGGSGRVERPLCSSGEAFPRRRTECLRVPLGCVLAFAVSEPPAPKWALGVARNAGMGGGDRGDRHASGLRKMAGLPCENLHLWCFLHVPNAKFLHISVLR
jgi:hypothetical protein